VNPEALSPLASRRNRLQVIVLTRLLQVECIGGPAHRLEADEIAIFWRVDHSNGILGSIDDSDTLFRALKDIAVGDDVSIETTAATYTYRVTNTKIVKPSDVSVLRSNNASELTMITCYPFYYVGAAPRRFIVRAVSAPAPSVETH